MISGSPMTLSRLTVLSYKVKPMADPVPAHLPSKSRLRCCAVVEYHQHVLPGTEWVMFTSNRFNCFSVPHWLLEKWGMLSVKWCVTDEATQVTLCTRWKTPHPEVEVNTGHFSCFAFLPFIFCFIMGTWTQDFIKLCCHRNCFDLNTSFFKLNKYFFTTYRTWPWANYYDAKQLQKEY